MTFHQTEDAQLANETGASPASAGTRKGGESPTRDEGGSSRETRRVALGSPSLCPGLSPTPRPPLTVAEGTVSGAGTTQTPCGSPRCTPPGPGTCMVTAVTLPGVPGVPLQEAPNPALTWPSAPPATSCWLSPSMKRLRTGEAGERKRRSLPSRALAQFKGNYQLYLFLQSIPTVLTHFLHRKRNSKCSCGLS